MIQCMILANAPADISYLKRSEQLIVETRDNRQCDDASSRTSTSIIWYEYGSRDFAGRFGLDFSMAVVAVPFILYLVRFCSSKSCKDLQYNLLDRGGDGRSNPKPL